MQKSCFHGKPSLTRYQQAIMSLNSLQSNAVTIQKMREMRNALQEYNVPGTAAYLDKLGITLDQINDLNVIHVSGTKGKGSTCAFVESMLRGLGLKTGLYTSPHLIHARERIRINGKPISEDIFEKNFFHVYNQLSDCEDMPAYFKFLTLMAFHVFREEKVDVAIIEVGIGGEYDCTNVVRKPIVCGITTLDIDHTSILGSTLPEIAWHKAGICKQSVPCVVTTAQPESMVVMEKRAYERNTVLSTAPQFSQYTWPTRDFNAGIDGDHQKVNISLALQLVREWVKQRGMEEAIFSDASENKWMLGKSFVVPDVLVDAIANCRWPGRSQIVNLPRICYFLDGAHTPKSMEMCSKWFSKAVANRKRRRVLVFQCTADRNPATLLPFLNDQSFDLAAFSPTVLNISQDKSADTSNFNQSTSDQLERSNLCAKIWEEQGNKETHIFDCITSLVKWLDEQSATEELDVLVTGSLHLVGGVLSLVSKE